MYVRDTIIGKQLKRYELQGNEFFWYWLIEQFLTLSIA